MCKKKRKCERTFRRTFKSFNIFSSFLCRQQSEVVASLKSDKDALETTLYEAQQLNAQLETRKEQLEGENQELILKKENLTGK